MVKSTQKSRTKDVEIVEAEVPTESSSQVSDEAINDLLDEIDDVLIKEAAADPEVELQLAEDAYIAIQRDLWRRNVTYDEYEEQVLLWQMKYPNIRANNSCRGAQVYRVK